NAAIPAASATVRAPRDEAGWRAQKAAIRARSKGQRAPIAAINAVENAIRLPGPEALAKEREVFLVLKNSRQSKALRYVFFAERSVSKLPRLKGIAARPFAKIGIVGGGTMGAGITPACLLAGLNVTMLERDQEALNAGLERVRKTLDQSLARQLIDKATLHRMLAALNGALDYDALGTADLVIEAVFEDMAVKKQVFARLDAAVRPDAILASNTSYLDIGEISGAVHDASRVLGLHFFSPAYIMKLLEIIHTDAVADDVLATAIALARRLRKIAVPAGVCDGFIANRMMSAYRRDCEYMLEDGALPQDIDAAMVAFGFPMGVFAMQDLAGLEIARAARQRRAATRPVTGRYVDIADRLCELGRIGRKSGLGWYDYAGDPAGKPDPAVERLILRESARKGISRRVFDSDQIMSRILSVLQNEGQRVLDEGVAQSEQAIDVVMVNGYGFPRWRGGPMFMRANF
ncbi:MAG: 3-hydroxyacyl-CoA dehydrogenase NAD-binding domain-containing protein, partial [Paracoccaceae bacterium]